MIRLMPTIMGSVSEFERAMVRERQLEGIAKAKQAGKYRGGNQPLRLLSYSRFGSSRCR
jgi:DNA invertase Pin-like site-specific DNA recombinase